MKKRKRIREKGKIKLSRVFQELKEGDRVAVVRELARKGSFPSRIHGRTGVIEKIRGKAYIVKIKDYKKDKKYIIEAIHLRKLK